MTSYYNLSTMGGSALHSGLLCDWFRRWLICPGFFCEIRWRSSGIDPLGPALNGLGGRGTTVSALETLPASSPIFAPSLASLVFLPTALYPVPVKPRRRSQLLELNVGVPDCLDVLLVRLRLGPASYRVHCGRAVGTYDHVAANTRSRLCHRHEPSDPLVNRLNVLFDYDRVGRLGLDKRPNIPFTESSDGLS